MRRLAIITFILSFNFQAVAICSVFGGLSTRNQLTDKCVKNSRTYQECRSALDNYPSYPKRMREAFTCVKKFKKSISVNDCYDLGRQYNPLAKNIISRCDKLYEQKEYTDPNNPGEEEVFHF